MTRLNLYAGRCFGGVALASLFSTNIATAASSLAPGFTSSPGQVIYNYSSPQVAIYAGVQVGNNVTASVMQSSSHNVAGLAQAGASTKANITQTGAVNNAYVAQYSHVNSALVVQFGPSTSLLNQ